jgi:hypothetical protein
MALESRCFSSGSGGESAWASEGSNRRLEVVTILAVDVLEGPIDIA